MTSRTRPTASRGKARARMTRRRSERTQWKEDSKEEEKVRTGSVHQLLLPLVSICFFPAFPSLLGRPGPGRGPHVSACAEYVNNREHGEAGWLWADGRGSRFKAAISPVGKDAAAVILWRNF